MSCRVSPAHEQSFGYTHVRDDDVDGLVGYFDVAQADNANHTIGGNRQTEFGK